jgi:predicted nucleic acid-binding protein
VSIGANWADIWGPVWKSVWTQEAAEPPPEPEATQKPAGRKRRRRLLVEIDGQEFEVSSPSEALSLLARAREVAQAQVEKARKAPVRIASGVARPRIRTGSPELRIVVDQARSEILSLYDGLERDIEIAALMQAADEEEEETIIRLLM